MKTLFAVATVALTLGFGAAPAQAQTMIVSSTQFERLLALSGDDKKILLESFAKGDVIVLGDNLGTGGNDDIPTSSQIKTNMLIDALLDRALASLREPTQ